MSRSVSGIDAPGNAVDSEASCSVYIRFWGVNGYGFTKQFKGMVPSRWTLKKSTETQQFPDSLCVRKNKGFQKLVFANSCTVYLLPDWPPTREITGDFGCATMLTPLNTSGNC